jgi:outer membrane protein assembly factor BamB
MMLQRPKRMPQVQTSHPEAHRLRQMPVARQKVSGARAVVPIAVSVLAAGAAVAISTGVGRRALGIGQKQLWGGLAPQLADVDGDGTPDIIGTIRYVMDNDRTHLAAYSGKTGDRLWESESLGNYSNMSQTKVVTHGSLILLASKRGTLEGRDAKTGKSAWKISLSEKIDLMCDGGKDQVIVETADDKWFAIDAKGKKQPTEALLRLDQQYTNDAARSRFDAAGGPAEKAEKPDDDTPASRRRRRPNQEKLPENACIPLGGQWRSAAGLVTLQSWHDLAKVDGMTVERLARKPGGSITVGLGHKSPGTAVPMIAKIVGMHATWVTDIPSVDPLVASFDQKHFAMTDKAAFALYKLSGTPEKFHLAAFDLASGKRLWDKQIAKGNIAGMVASAGTVLVSTWSDLRAYDASNGNERFSIGSRN